MTPTGAVSGMGDPPAGWHLGLLAMDVVKEKTTETERDDGSRGWESRWDFVCRGGRMCHGLGMRKMGTAQEPLVAVPRASQRAVTAPVRVLHPPAERGTLLGEEGRRVWQLPPSPSVQKVEETLFKASASVFLKLLLDSFQMNLNWKVLQVPDGAGICKREV